MSDLVVVTDEASAENAIVSLLPAVAETAQQAVARQLATFTAINTLVDRVFTKGVDYDVIPGTSKPTLMLPGIEKTMGLLGLREEYNDLHTERVFDEDTPFFFYEVECVLYHSQSGMEVARGQGVCHTREKSFMRKQDRVCPNCGEPAIIKGKAEYGGGWLCWKRKDGCGSKFGDNDPQITSQQTGMVADTQLIWDGINRARKIANKRAKADAVKRIGMLSEKFTVDLEDFVTFTDAEIAESRKPQPEHPSVSDNNTKQEEPAPETPNTQDSNEDNKDNSYSAGDLWTAIYTNRTLLERYNSKQHIANAVNKDYVGNPEHDGFDKVFHWLMNRDMTSQKKQQPNTA